MKIQFISKTEEARVKLIEWAKKNKESNIIKEKPAIIEEVYKDSAVDYILNGIAKKIKMPKLLITKNQIYINTLTKKLQRKAIKTLKLNKNDIKVVIIDG